MASQYSDILRPHGDGRQHHNACQRPPRGPVRGVDNILRVDPYGMAKSEKVAANLERLRLDCFPEYESTFHRRASDTRWDASTTGALKEPFERYIAAQCTILAYRWHRGYCTCLHLRIQLLCAQDHNVQENRCQNRNSHA